MRPQTTKLKTYAFTVQATDRFGFQSEKTVITINDLNDANIAITPTNTDFVFNEDKASIKWGNFY